ncbi:MAG: hypothetical protein Fur0010_27700 [Bdellovibrio sp.]
MVLLLLTSSMLVFEYFGWQGPFHQHFQATSWYRDLNLNYRNFYAQIWTTGAFFILMVCLPIFVLKFIVKNDAWLLSKPKLETLKFYNILYFIMLPVLIFISMSPNFYRFYPLYRPVTMSDWLLFELVYLPQFFAVEFFFRGPLLAFFEKLKEGFGVFFMTLPYALIHIHKPFPEAIGSIFAGIVLGHLALKGKSIWPGVILHMAIALTMDYLGLFQSGFFN